MLSSGTKETRCKSGVFILNYMSSCFLQWLMKFKLHAILETDKQQDLMNVLGATNAAIVFLGFTNASAVQSVVATERTVFYRGRTAGMYSELSYAFAQVWGEIIHELQYITSSFLFSAKTQYEGLQHLSFIWIFSCAGGHRDTLCCNSNLGLCSSSLPHDWVPLTSGQVLVFLLLHIHVLYLLNLWDDGGCSHSWPSNCCYC